jgi:PAS domain-containing protein
VTSPTSTVDSRLLCESLFEHSADGALFGKPDGTVLRANPAASRLLGGRLVFVTSSRVRRVETRNWRRASIGSFAAS